MSGGGYQADTGQLSAGAKSYSQEGDALGQAAGKLTPTVSTGQVGKAWSDVAGKYGEAFGKFKDGVAKYGSTVTDFGGSLGSASQSYSANEQSQQKSIPGQD
ncbi:hypothetical protein FPZ12_010170 [Amycolatopsis acidicola]|uniref:Uncharacterized protein n=1 Tax=Amycolatopsis acidicola TaxID=2596893 RepID=A0A5N0V906_9PSEU|nr:hypothetical protein [Amycolatopsis acidicola]KAA9162879.1 hypothetical protein FPZ12_010170 [Amycolatopsis acidicola]